ncbi:MAG TPA: SAM-dependent methyltransferase, partial [Blastocatellia bacterium]|nr:SAM-dependent methyltransferase [Blastocatellia bacterium]
QNSETQDLIVTDREVGEGVETGLSRPSANESVSEFTLGSFARVMRGIATGANEFFFLTAQQAKELSLPASMLLRAVGRTRDVPEEVITEQTLLNLENAGRPSFLFAPDGRDIEDFPVAVQQYLVLGEAAGLPLRPLIAQRRPWYKMETRKAPAFLFAYLGRRNARFIRNEIGVLPLTGFLCVYPRQEDHGYIERLWQVLKHPDTVKNLGKVGKSYGSGAIKVEPRALERLPLPDYVVAQVGLMPAISQLTLY